MLKIIKLDNIQLSNIMPPNLLRDEKVRNLDSVISKELQIINQHANQLNYTMNLRKLPESVIDHLLWENHIYPNEGLDLADTLEKKISLLENAIEIHRHKGTPFAVERSLESIGIKGKIIEWFEYEGNPYHFRVLLENPLTSQTDFDRLVKMIDVFKNTRSYLEKITIKRSNDMNLFVGGVISTRNKVQIIPTAFKIPELNQVKYFGGVISTRTQTTIKMG